MKLESNPIISIITPCLNRADMIETAIQSVLDQDYPQVEHIIMDNASTAIAKPRKLLIQQ